MHVDGPSSRNVTGSFPNVRRGLHPGIMAAGLLGLLCTYGSVAQAQGDMPANTTAEKETDAKPAGLVIAGVRLSVQFEGGFSLNPSRPADGLNFGQLNTDHANQFQLVEV